MERMWAIVFDDELKAFDGYRALKELDLEEGVSVHDKALIKKNDDGTIDIKQKKEELPVSTVGDAAFGALIGLMGGPIGLAVGAVGGAVMGSFWDRHLARVNAEFLNDVSAKLTPGKWAVVAKTSEELVASIDTRMAALGGTVFCTAWENVEDEQYTRDIAGLKANISQLKAKQAKSRADQKVKLQTKIDNLQEKLCAKLEQAKQRAEQQEKEEKAKVEALERKAAKAEGEAKAAIEKRIADIKKRAKKSQKTLTSG